MYLQLVTCPNEMRMNEEEGEEEKSIGWPMSHAAALSTIARRAGISVDDRRIATSPDSGGVKLSAFCVQEFEVSFIKVTKDRGLFLH